MQNKVCYVTRLRCTSRMPNAATSPSLPLLLLLLLEYDQAQSCNLDLHDSFSAYINTHGGL